MKRSFGIVILNERREILVCHATGCSHWDVPKGGADEGESPRQAALRECREETGLDFSAANLQDLGVRHYLPGKDLHLFLVRVNACDVALEGMTCTSTFQQKPSGRWLPEVDAFKWAAIDQLNEVCTERMTATLRTLKELA